MAKTETRAADGEEQSMEEILQSIRRIIAEDGEEGAEAAPQKVAEAEAPAAETPVPAAEAQPEASESEEDVLELTDMVTESGAVVSLSEEEEVEAEPADEADSAADDDVLKNIDAMLGNSAKAEEKPAQATETPDIAKRESADSLLSATAASAAAQAFSALKRPPAEAPPIEPLPFRSGTTVEELMMELLRPMLKEWLDTNLPPLVQRIVEREVRKLTQ